MKATIYYLVLAFLIISCKNEAASELDSKMAEFDQLKEQTLALHDKVMPETMYTMDLQAEIDEHLTSKNVDEAVAEELVIAQLDLSDAYDAMMTWMKDYSMSFPFEEETPESLQELSSQIAQLEERYSAMETIDTETHNAISIAESLLAAIE